MDDAKLDAVREGLERERDQQLAALDEWGAAPYDESVSGAVVHEPGFADTAQETEALGEALAHIDAARTRLRQIDEALERLAEGKYGICVDCGNEIPAERLEARPHSIRCRDCAERAEAAQ